MEHKVNRSEQANHSTDCKINIDSVIQILPFLKDNNGDYIKDPVFINIDEK